MQRAPCTVNGLPVLLQGNPNKLQQKNIPSCHGTLSPPLAVTRLLKNTLSLIPFCLFPIACCLSGVAYGLLQARCLSPMARCLLPVVNCQSPIAYHLLPIKYRLSNIATASRTKKKLPTAYRLSPIAYRLLPIAYVRRTVY